MVSNLSREVGTSQPPTGFRTLGPHSGAGATVEAMTTSETPTNPVDSASSAPASAAPSLRVTLIGAHGKIALLAAPLLVAAGHQVEGVVRNPDHSADVEATGATARVSDIETLDAEDWDDLLRGADAVVWSAGAGGGSAERTRAVDRDAAIAAMDAAVRVGVPRFVMVSYFGAGPDHGIAPDDAFYPYAQAKTQADAHLEAASALDRTILRPSRLTDDEPSGVDVNARTPDSVARGDVAAMIAAVVARTDLNGRAVEFNGGTTPASEALDQVAARP